MKNKGGNGRTGLLVTIGVVLASLIFLWKEALVSMDFGFWLLLAVLTPLMVGFIYALILSYVKGRKKEDNNA